MITVYRKKNVVMIDWDLFVGEHSQHVFSHSIGDEKNDAVAQLMAVHMRTQIADRVRQIRKEAYDQGWKDAKTKHRKKKTFSQSFNTGVSVGY